MPIGRSAHVGILKGAAARHVAEEGFNRPKVVMKGEKWMVFDKIYFKG
jgi:hypothetical protein